MRHQFRRPAALVIALLVALALAVVPSTTVTTAGAAAGSSGKPAAHAAEKPGHAWVRSTVSRMGLRELVGQLFMTYAYGDTADTQDPDHVAANQELYGVDNAAQLVERYKLGGVIYYNWSDNANNPQQIAALSNGVQDAALSTRLEVPALVATDQEGGIVARVGPPATVLPGNMALGAGRSADDAETAAAIIGEELRAIGVNWNFAPVADVNVNPANPVIGVRSFSEDPALASDLTAAQVRGYSGSDVAGAAKHFPGHGDTSVDSHFGLPEIDHTRAEWEAVDRPPFQAAIDEGVRAIMTAHIVVDSLDPSGAPATMSRPIITGILREEMGYDGVIVTDALDMGGATETYPSNRVPVAALQAGVDMLLKPPDGEFLTMYDAVLDAVRNGEVSKKRLRTSVQRILQLKWDLGLVEDPYVDVDAVPEVVGTDEHLAAAQALTDRSTTLVKNDGTLPLDPEASQSVLVTGWGVGTTATIADKLSERGADPTVLETGAAPTAAQIAAAEAAAEEHDVTVVVSYRAWMNDNAAQRELVRRLTATGKPVIAVAAREAHDIAYYPEVPAYLSTYSWTGVSLESLVRVLYGEVDPTGTLPVTIPTAEDPDTVLYPFGHGLGYGG
ncbi:glycoside hydrolase family 3 protein [Nocardioides sp.]|uniref:glycoside hydrolase family 3 protein n=1 Tax=Nocardioides sp. TaxID=35761 RepID=UPI002ED305FB